MTTWDWIKIIVAALIGASVKPVFDKLITPLLPDHKTMWSYILVGLRLFLGLGVPLLFIILEFVADQPVTKAFIFKIVLFQTILLLNTTLAMVIFVLKNINDVLRIMKTLGSEPKEDSKE